MKLTNAALFHRLLAHFINMLAISLCDTLVTFVTPSWNEQFRIGIIFLIYLASCVYFRTSFGKYICGLRIYHGGSELRDPDLSLKRSLPYLVLGLSIIISSGLEDGGIYVNITRYTAISVILFLFGSLIYSIFHPQGFSLTDTLLKTYVLKQAPQEVPPHLRGKSILGSMFKNF